MVCLLVQFELTESLDGSNIEAHLQRMRRQRFGLVQTADQLRFAYMAISEGIKRIEFQKASQPPAVEEPSLTKPAEEEEEKEVPVKETTPSNDDVQTKEEKEEEVLSTSVSAPAGEAVEKENGLEHQAADERFMSPLKRPFSSEYDESEDIRPPKKQQVPLNGTGPAAESSCAVGAAHVSDDEQSGHGSASVQHEDTVAYEECKTPGDEAVRHATAAAAEVQEEHPSTVKDHEQARCVFVAVV